MSCPGLCLSRRFLQFLTVFVLVASLSSLSPGVATAQPTASASQLDELVAPVALYPDPILSQVMTASTFPDEVKAAKSWSAEHKDLQGQELSDAMAAESFEWDASVQALVPFPSVLETMTRDSGWLEDFGNAVLAQRGDVMDSVQRMRKKAQDAGNLKSSEQITVETTSPTVIEIQPANPQVIYVPTYDPAVVYAPAPAGSAAGAAMFGFMAGVMVAEMFDDDWYGGCGFGWSSHTVIVHNSAWGRTWNNRYAYHPPYQRPVYSNRNVNVNVGNVNIDNSRNVNIDKSKRDVDVDKNRKPDKGIDRGVEKGKGSAGKTGMNKAGTAKAKTSPGSAERGYSRSAGSSSKGALGASTNGRSEAKASARGKSSSGGASQASASRASGSHGGGGKRGGKK